MLSAAAKVKEAAARTLTPANVFMFYRQAIRLPFSRQALQTIRSAMLSITKDSLCAKSS
jgi:hypothetical protein